MSVTVRVPAKVNVQLAVGGGRPDGYHEPATIFLLVGGAALGRGRGEILTLLGIGDQRQRGQRRAPGTRRRGPYSRGLLFAGAVPGGLLQ